MNDAGIAGIIVGLIGGIGSIYALLKNDLREQYKSVCIERDDWQKRFLASELSRETLQKENVDLIRDSLEQDRLIRELRRELKDALNLGRNPTNDRPS